MSKTTKINGAISIRNQAAKAYNNYLKNAESAINTHVKNVIAATNAEYQARVAEVAAMAENHQAMEAAAYERYFSAMETIRQLIPSAPAVAVEAIGLALRDMYFPAVPAGQSPQRPQTPRFGQGAARGPQIAFHKAP